MSSSATKSRRRLLCWGMFLGAITPVFIRVVMTGSVPLGVDGGQWVALGRTFFATHHPRGMYPPLVPLLAWLLTLLLPFRAALSVLALAAAAAPGIGVGLFARRLNATPLVSVLAAFALSATGMTGETFLWAGYPQLVALGFVPLALLALEELLSPGVPTRSVRSSQTLLAVMVVAIASTSHLVLLSTIAAMFVMIASRLRFKTTLGALRSLRRPVLYCVLCAFLLTPVYISISETFAASRSDTVSSRFSQLIAAYQYVLRAELIPYGVLILAAVVLLWRSMSSRGVLSASAAVLCSILLPYLLRERRLAYLAGTAVAMLLIVASTTLTTTLTTPMRLRSVVGAVAALAAVFTSVVGLSRTQTDNDFYEYVTPAALELAEQTARFSASDEAVAVTSVRSFPFGWWVEGAAARRTYSMSNREVLYRASELRDLDVALRVFKASNADPFPSTYGLSAARAHNIRLLVVPWSWGGVSKEELDDRTSSCRKPCTFSVVFQNEFGALVRVNA